jgi:hypothetical protein
MADLAPITVPPGQNVLVKVKIDRGGARGPATIQLGVAPAGIAALPLEIPADKSEGQLSIAAKETLGDQELKAQIKVVARVGLAVAEKNLDVTVPKLSLPIFQTAKPVLLQPGGSAVVEIAVNRNGFQGALDLRVENVPAKVTATIGKLDPSQSTAKLTIAAAADAPDVAQPLRVAATVCTRPVSMELPVQIDRAPFRVQSFIVVNLKPGEKKRVEVPVERRSYQGPLTLAPTALPEGVTIQKVEISADQKTAALEIVAAENARERVGSARLTVQGGQMSNSDAMVIRVRHDEEQGFVPREVLNDPNMPLLRRGSFGGRLTAKTKHALLEAFGGTPESEAAVMRGLSWLVAHQQEDGSWPLASYDKDVEGCDCRDKDVEKQVTAEDAAGTAFGALPFLGAGVGIDRSPEEPAELVKYQKVVRRAIAFLVKNQTKSKEKKEDGRLSGNMYAHAAATIALCEAYGLSTDRHKEQLKVPAQRAIKFIAQSQHKAGGWRYAPGQEGDMSAVAWQFLAIRSGQLAGLMIGNDPLIRAERFVDSCAAGPQGAEKSQYCYQPGEGKKSVRPSLTAAGLLTREYLGRWSKDNPDLAAGCRYLMQNLPPDSGDSLGSIYYYYYATQVLHHMEGSDFDLWNYRMREHLIRTQEKSGHRTGSWNPAGSDWGAAGGRLYATSLALMTLEVYYRHLPMYRAVKSKAQSDSGTDES